jgi:hypothetical protein
MERRAGQNEVAIWSVLSIGNLARNNPVCLDAAYFGRVHIRNKYLRYFYNTI